MTRFPSRNVYGQDLAPCGADPVTGFFRDGCCNTGYEDAGIHTVCAEVTREFLEYSRDRGNDLMAPNLDTAFPGLQPGDRWCLCAGRWLEAQRAGKAPGVYLESTHEETLAVIPLDLLKQYALDSSARS